MPAANSSCIICAAPLAVHRANELLCGNPMCQWKFKSVPDSLRCTICGRELAQNELARRTCANFECQRAWLVDRPIAYRRMRRQQLEAAAHGMREDTAAAAGVRDVESWRMTFTPYNYAVAYRIPERRRQLLRDHLRTVAMQAIRYKEGLAAGTEKERPPLPPLDPPPAEVGAMLMNACIACRGYCCRTGGEHAYITPYTMLAYFEQHPDHSVDQMIDAYVAYVPRRALKDGCVYQHAQGCTLPRDMRGDTCNRFFCGSLTEVRQAVADGAPAQVFFVPTHDGELDKGVFSSPTFVQIVKRKQATATT